MKNIKQSKAWLLVAMALALSSGVQAFYNSNMEVPYDKYAKKGGFDNQFKVGMTVDYGVRNDKGYDNDSFETNVLQVYSPTESARAMLKDNVVLFPDGYDPDSLIGPFGTLDGNWGDFSVTGKFQQTAATVWGRGSINNDSIPGKIFFGFAIPVKSVSVTDVVFKDLTDPDADIANPTIIENFTSQLASYVKTVGKLNIGEWKKQGFGDTTVYAGWAWRYDKDSGPVTSASFSASLGLCLPTGRERDLDEAFSTPFGYDGAWGIPYNASASVHFENGISMGMGLDLLWLAQKTKTRRMKTSADQTSFLLLSKGMGTLKPGHTLKFNSFIKHKLTDQVKFSLSYQAIRHSNDQLFAPAQGFDAATVNTAAYMQEWTAQNLTIKGHFSSNATSDDAPIHEISLNLYYRMPLTGKLITKNHIIGGEVCFSF